MRACIYTSTTCIFSCPVVHMACDLLGGCRFTLVGKHCPLWIPDLPPPTNVYSSSLCYELNSPLFHNTVSCVLCRFRTTKVRSRFSETWDIDKMCGRDKHHHADRSNTNSDATKTTILHAAWSSVVCDVIARYRGDWDDSIGGKTKYIAPICLHSRTRLADDMRGWKGELCGTINVMGFVIAKRWSDWLIN